MDSTRGLKQHGGAVVSLREEADPTQENLEDETDSCRERKKHALTRWWYTVLLALGPTPKVLRFSKATELKQPSITASCTRTPPHPLSTT